MRTNYAGSVPLGGEMPDYKLPLQSRRSMVVLLVSVVAVLVAIGLAIPFVFGDPS